MTNEQADDMLKQLSPQDRDEYFAIASDFLVPEELREEVLKFAITGDASREFTDYLDTNEDCQQTLEKAFLKRIERVQDILGALTVSEKVPAASAQSHSASHTPSKPAFASRR